MQQKDKLRKLYLNKRKKYYYDVDKNFFSPLLKLIRKRINKKHIKIALYYPSNFELNVLKGGNRLLSKKVRYVLVEKHFFKLHKNNSKDNVDFFLKKNKFKLVKKFTFPLLNFQDNLYVKRIISK